MANIIFRSLDLHRCSAKLVSASRLNSRTLRPPSSMHLLAGSTDSIAPSSLNRVFRGKSPLEVASLVLARLVMSMSSNVGNGVAMPPAAGAGLTANGEASGRSSSPGPGASVSERLARIVERMHIAYDSSPEIVRAVARPRLVAVSKFQTKDKILEAYERGQRDFGENYVQELVDKSNDPEILEKCPDIRWHFIGSCQSNKVNKVLKTKNLSMLETVSTAKLADKLQKAIASGQGKEADIDNLRILVQVNTSGEANKEGVEPGHPTLDLVKHIREKCPNLTFAGLMTIGALAHSVKGDGAAGKSSEPRSRVNSNTMDSLSSDQHCDSLRANPDFVKLKDERQKVSSAINVPQESLELSMGMSNDFEEAVRMGSTNIRVGSSIFGPRPKKDENDDSKPPSAKPDSDEVPIEKGTDIVKEIDSALGAVKLT